MYRHRVRDENNRTIFHDIPSMTRLWLENQDFVETWTVQLGENGCVISAEKYLEMKEE